MSRSPFYSSATLRAQLDQLQRSRARQTPGTEAQLKTAVLKALSCMRGVHVLRLNAGLTVIGKGDSKRAVRGVEPGTPDILVMLTGGRVLWLELKAPGGKLSDIQRAWHARARSLGHEVHEIRHVQDAVDVVNAALRGAR